jgi:hypothetical protein
MLEKKVFHPVKHSPIMPIPSKMFLKKKLDSKGALLKWKARLVAGGHLQSPDDTVIRSSPTVHHNSFMLTSLIAADSTRKVASVDVTGAYLLVDMTSDVYMTLQKQLVDILIPLDPFYAEFIKPNGEIVVKLDKALYGCVESARLWFNEVSSHLQSLNYKQSEVDSCVFFKTENGETTVVIVYVDDFLISAKEIKQLNSLIDSIRFKYQSIQATFGPVLEYLGMNLDFSKKNQSSILIRSLPLWYLLPLTSCSRFVTSLL